MRRERDSLGELDVPDEAYYGIQTVRCAGNYLVSDHTYNEYPEISRAIAEIKKACAMTNAQIGALSQEKADAIMQACDEVIAGKFEGHFPVNVWRSQGTGINMNLNEVIANRANEILTGKRGYDAVHPNSHVNMCQSSNDVFPTAENIVLLREIKPLIEDFKAFRSALNAKAKEFQDNIRLGRTGFQDAVPMTWGQVFGGWESSAKRVIALLENFETHMHEGVLCGTAVGTGMGLLPGYADHVYENLSKVVGFPMHLTSMEDEVIPDSAIFDGMRNTDHHFILMGYVKALAACAARIAQDLVLFSSGPRAGIRELTYGDREKDQEAVISAEAMMDVLGETLATEKMALLSSAEGQLDHGSQNSAAFISMIDAIRAVRSAVTALTEKAVKPVQVNDEVCRRNAELSTSLSTMVSALFGYPVGTAIAKRAIREGISCKEAALREKVLPPEVCEDLFDIKRLVNRRTMIDIFNKYRNYRKIS